MPTFRLDDYASIYQAPTAVPGESGPAACVFRGMNNEEEARKYADKVCLWFADNGCPQPVFVVAGPTSTTTCRFEVVDATAGYKVIHRSISPKAARVASSVLEVVLDHDAAKPLDEQVVLHAMVLYEMLGSTPEQLERIHMGLKRCQGFVKRNVPLPTWNSGHSRGIEQEGDPQRKLCAEFLAFEWPEQYAGEIGELFRSYIRLCYLEVNGPVNHVTTNGTQVEATSPLDWAVRRNRRHQMGILIEEGADLSVVPPQDVVRGSDGRVWAHKGEIIPYIETMLNIDTDAMSLRARHALMTRKIAEYAAKEAAGSTSKPTRRSPRL